MSVHDKPWLLPNPSRVKLLGPACVAYGHPDLSLAGAYLRDFGLVESFRTTSSNGSESIHYRGYGTQPVIYIATQTATPEFLGSFYEAATEEDLVKAAGIPGASERGIEQWVCGGKVVSVVDPDGLKFHVVYGMEKRPFTPRRGEVLPVNYCAERDDDVGAKPRRNEYHRLTRGIIPIHKLGHVGHIIHNMDVTTTFYTTHFNFTPSDIMLNPDKTINMIFFHVSLGPSFTDHHAFFLATPLGPMVAGRPHHAAFEVESIDTQFIGHEYLTEKGYKSFWGVGRHIEGSQVFDYWWDVDGFLVEHYADGDLVNEDHVVGWVEAREGGPVGSNWGPELRLPGMPEGDGRKEELEA